MNTQECILTCHRCALYPCKKFSDLDYELTKYAQETYAQANAIIDDINAVSDIDFSAFDTTLDSMLRDQASEDYQTVNDIGEVMGLPADNDAERLSSLGIALIGPVSWLRSDTTNFDDLRTLFLSLGGDYSKMVSFLDGNYGSTFVIYSVVESTSYESSERHYTLAELSSLVGRKVYKQEVSQFLTEGTYYSILKKERHLGFNQHINNVCRNTGLEKNEITVRVFSLTSSVDKSYLLKLQQYGVSQSQIAALSTKEAIYENTYYKSLLTSMLSECSQSASPTEVRKLKELSRELVSSYSSSNTFLDTALLPALLVKNTTKEIVAALYEPFVKGVNYNATQAELISSLQGVLAVESGTHNISNRMMSLSPDYILVLLLKFLNIKSLSYLLNLMQDATHISNLITEAIVYVDGVDKPDTGLSFKSYDSGSSLILRLINMDKTFAINTSLNVYVESKVPTLSNKAVLEMIKCVYNSILRIVDAFKSKINAMLAKIEKLMSVSLALTGRGAFETSFMKCAAGVDAHLNWNPLRDIINEYVDKFNQFLSECIQVLEKTLKELFCKVKCIQEMLGMDGYNAKDFPFCNITIPPLYDIDPIFSEIAKVLDLFRSMFLAHIGSNSSKKPELLDLANAVTEVKNSCSCEPASGIFKALRYATLGLQAAGGLASMKKPNVSDVTKIIKPKF